MKETIINVLVIIIVEGFVGYYLRVFILLLGGLNEDLNNNNSKRKRKKTKYNFLFPKINYKHHVKKVVPECLYIIVFAFQITLYILSLISLINSLACIVLCCIDIEFNVLSYCLAFIFTDMFIRTGILFIANYIIHKECKGD